MQNQLAYLIYEKFHKNFRLFKIAYFKKETPLLTIPVHFHTVLPVAESVIGLTGCPDLIVPKGTVGPDKSTRLRKIKHLG